MTGWTAVLLTRAHQVAALMGVEEDDLPEPSLSAEAHYRALLDGGETARALDYLGHALPRMEVVAWAADLLHAESLRHEPPRRDRLALDHALRWLGEPSEANRRSARAAADAAAPRSPERALGMAVFYSGGSMVSPDLPPVLPPPYACNRWATGAVIAAANRSDTPAAFRARALSRGEAVATSGVEALRAA